MKYLLLLMSLSVFAQYKIEIDSQEGPCKNKCPMSSDTKQELEKWYKANSTKGDFGANEKTIYYDENETPKAGYESKKDVIIDENGEREVEENLIDLGIRKAKELVNGKPKKEKRMQKVVYAPEFKVKYFSIAWDKVVEVDPRQFDVDDVGIDPDLKKVKDKEKNRQDDMDALMIKIKDGTATRDEKIDYILLEKGL